mgnify:CR=1 FL=1
MRRVLGLTVIALFGLALGACDEAPTTPGSSLTPETATSSQRTVGSQAGSLGKVTLDTEVSSWDIGTGNPNGEFITAEGQGVVIGLRALERFQGLLGVTGTRGNRVAVYEAPAGPSPLSAGDNNGTWNYDFHVDLSGARGKHAGKTLSDYTLLLEQDFTDQSLFGALGSDPVRLPLAAEPPVGTGVCSNDTFSSTLCQQSWNAGFGNTDYDPDEEGTYDLRLILLPETFRARPLAVAIRVIVTSGGG